MHNILKVGKPEGNMQVGRLKGRREDDIIMATEIKGCNAVDFIQVCRIRDQPVADSLENSTEPSCFFSI
jgi:hypothetical protein